MEAVIIIVSLICTIVFVILVANFLTNYINVNEKYITKEEFDVISSAVEKKHSKDGDLIYYAVQIFFAALNVEVTRKDALNHTINYINN